MRGIKIQIEEDLDIFRSTEPGETHSGFIREAN